MRKQSAAIVAGAVTTALVLPAASAGATTAPRVSTLDKAYLQASAATDLAEISLAKVALTKGSTPETRRFATRMIKDHLMMLADVRTVAKATDVVLPTKPTAAQLATAKAVSAQSGIAFDDAYLTAQVKGHLVALAVGVVETKKGSNARIKGNAVDGRPMIAYHLWLAGQYLGWVKKAE